jgi:hypothetical protein
VLDVVQVPFGISRIQSGHYVTKAESISYPVRNNFLESYRMISQSCYNKDRWFILRTLQKYELYIILAQRMETLYKLRMKTVTAQYLVEMWPLMTVLCCAVLWTDPASKMS